MLAEFLALLRNKTWILTTLPPGKNLIGLRGRVSGSLSSENNASEDDSKKKQISNICHAASMNVEGKEVDPSHLVNAPAHNEDHMMSWKDVVESRSFYESLYNAIKFPFTEKTFEDNVESGLTVFCPGDDAMKTFSPKFKNLTATGKQSLLEYHGIPVYQSIPGLKSSNGITNTLATDGASKFSFDVKNDGSDVTIFTKIVTAKIVNTLVDEQPLAIYQVNKVLMPEELFKGVLSPSPAPAPGPEADAESPKSSKKKHKSPPAPPEAPSDSPADAPDGDVADQSTNGAARFNGGGFVAVILSLGFAFLQL
ncbi:hypothetical protein SASPL_132840 [Salvia splendens]|uniref:FAS1 domain-containing protein n=1 Tax=Salvia splendens TaxID=180675 RepID=A0A8X8ZHW0_SALSN|nr:hypothetical protein SASPL_132840 [Salvia splendens]